MLAGVAAPVTIVAFGDSTTAPRDSLVVYADILRAELSNVRVLNAGSGGDSTEMARARFSRDVLDRKPGVVVIQFGINDSAVDVWEILRLPSRGWEWSVMRPTCAISCAS